MFFWATGSAVDQLVPNELADSSLGAGGFGSENNVDNGTTEGVLVQRD